VGRKSRKGLDGMDKLGARLKKLRQKSGLSQMKLAGKMGFNPTHGYKYIFRLEKGLVPNSTLRTIISFLEACKANWPDIVDVLPSSAGSETKAGKPVPRPAPASAPKPKKKRKPVRDTKPLRVRLRTQLLAERTERTRSFWKKVEEIEQTVSKLLFSLRVCSNDQRQYLAFVRSCCSIINAYPAAKTIAIEKDIATAVQSAVAKGLDLPILLRAKAVCIKHLSTPKTRKH